MAFIAKEDLASGYICFARKGTLVSPQAVEQFGWEDKVTEIPDHPTTVGVPTAKVKVMRADDHNPNSPEQGTDADPNVNREGEVDPNTDRASDEVDPNTQRQGADGEPARKRRS